MQENLQLSNFWEDIQENLKTFSEVGNDESKKTSSELLLNFNVNSEYVGDFDSLLNLIVKMYINDESVRSLYKYEESQMKSLLIFLESDFDKVIEMTNNKLIDKVNKAMQIWRTKKQHNDVIEQKIVGDILNKTLSKLDSSTLSDFGQKIGGAKKDIYRSYNEIQSSDILTKPLSKSFPEPDYKKMVAEGIITIDGALFVKFLYDKIPTKPRNKYRLKSWETTVQNAIDVLLELIESNDKSTIDRMKSGIGKYSWLSNEYMNFVDINLGLGFPENKVILGNYKIKMFESTYKNDENGDMVKIDEIRWTIVNGNNIVKDFKTKDEAIKGLGDLLTKITESPKTKKGTKFSAYQDGQTRGNFFIGKKTATGVIRLIENFTTQKEVFTYLKENQSKLQEIWDLMSIPVKERPETNKERVGTEWRKENENITAEKLSQSFGFRGIEFGNYVNTKERQDHVNNAYDSLMDMATTIGISTELLAFGGKLGLAFGARGSGNASAHYESDKVVINLTKKNGAGSLAHEYWHALDNYFGKQRKSSYAGQFITDKPRVLINRDGTQDLSVNPELVEAFSNIVNVINSTGIVKRSLTLDRVRTKMYWSTPIELTARCFENYIIEKLDSIGTKNDYLANFSAMAEWVSTGKLNAEESFPYPLSDESALINEAYEQFFDILKKVGLGLE
jgi:hypothetical protein